MYRLFVIASMVFALVKVNAQVYDMIVDASGNGDYTTIQDAINAVPDSQSIRTLIFIRNGDYQEKIAIPSTKKKVSLVGESGDGVIIRWDDHAVSGGMTTADSYTLWVDGEDSYFENLTIKNTAGAVGQAVALRSTGDKGILNNCKLTGFQDTYYAHKNRQYIFKSYIEGGTDFIFGDATAVFDSCTINSLKNGSYISAPADSKLISSPKDSLGNTFTFYHGLQFRNCDLVCEQGVPDNSYYLMRPWAAPASTVFITCKMGTHIKPVGWSTWNNNDHLYGFFGEYHSMDLNGGVLDVSQRADWSHQISDYNYRKFYNVYVNPAAGINYAYFFRNKDLYPNGDYDWSPYDILKSLNTPTNFSVSNRLISWDAVADAIGYVIYRDNEIVGFSGTSSYNDSTAQKDIDYQYVVKSVKSTGGVSSPSGVFNVRFTTSGVTESKLAPVKISVAGGMVTVSEPCVIVIYSMTGSFIGRKYVENKWDLSGLARGAYLLKITTDRGSTTIEKVIF